VKSGKSAEDLTEKTLTGLTSTISLTENTSPFHYTKSHVAAYVSECALVLFKCVCVCVLHRPHFSVIAASALAAFHSSHPAAQNELARLTCNLCYSCHPLVAICGTCKNLSKAEHAKHLAMVLIATQTEQPNGALRAWGKDWESSWWMRNS